MPDCPGQIIVVEASNPELTIPEIDLKEALPAATRLVSPVASLPAQRNLGVAEAGGEIVHFLDDDAIPQPGYFSMLESVLACPAVLGACGHVAGTEQVLPARWPLSILLGPGRPGLVSRSVRNEAMRSQEPVADVEWTPGCCMSFRTAVCRELEFDVRLSNGPLGGYSMGEDVEFSWRVSRRGRVLWVRDAVVEHHLSQENRASSVSTAEAATHFRARLAARYPASFSLTLLGVESAIRIGITLAGGAPKDVKKAAIRAVVKGLRSGRSLGRSER